MKQHFLPCLKMTFITMLLFGGVYPLAITGIAKLTASNGGQGAIIEANGKIAGFEIVGQSFVSGKYFNGRPSAVGYNAAATGGSNKGPTNPEYLATVEERIKDFLEKNPQVNQKDIPVDLITASGGGLDPHISPAAAEIQIPRIAVTRGINETVLRQLVKEHTEVPLFGLLGTYKVNVLKINLALDKIK